MGHRAAQSKLWRALNEFAPAAAGVIIIRLLTDGVRQEPPLPNRGRARAGAEVGGLAERIRARLPDKLLVTTEIQLAPTGGPSARRI